MLDLGIKKFERFRLPEEIIGEKTFSIPEIWFEQFQVSMPRGENRETISSIIHCDKITPFVRYQLNLTYSSQDGLSVTAEIIQDSTVTIQYLQPKSASEPAVPFLTAKNIKGSVLLSASSTQIWGGNGKIRYYVVLTAFERIACNLGRFSRRVPHCLSGAAERMFPGRGVAPASRIRIVSADCVWPSFRLIQKYRPILSVVAAACRGGRLRLQSGPPHTGRVFRTGDGYDAFFYHSKSFKILNLYDNYSKNLPMCQAVLKK